MDTLWVPAVAAASYTFGRWIGPSQPPEQGGTDMQDLVALAIIAAWLCHRAVVFVRRSADVVYKGALCATRDINHCCHAINDLDVVIDSLPWPLHSYIRRGHPTPYLP